MANIDDIQIIAKAGKTDTFFFANLGADVMRCISSAKSGNEKRYDASLTRAYATLGNIRKLKSYNAYEEGLLLLRGLAFAKSSNTLDTFSNRLNTIIGNLRF